LFERQRRERKDNREEGGKIRKQGEEDFCLKKNERTSRWKRRVFGVKQKGNFKKKAGGTEEEEEDERQRRERGEKEKITGRKKGAST